MIDDPLVSFQSCNLSIISSTPTLTNRPFYLEVDQRIPRRSIEEFDHLVYIHVDQLRHNVWKSLMDKSRSEDSVAFEGSVSPSTAFVFVESQQKGHQMAHHKKKATFLLSSLRHFAIECAEEGLPVVYLSTKGSFTTPLSQWLSQSPTRRLTCMEISDWDERMLFQELSESFAGQVSIEPNTLFIADVETWRSKIAPGFRMETFYREMRRQSGFLMDHEGHPEGGTWNYDAENRKKIPKGLEIPESGRIEPDKVTHEVMEMIEQWFPYGLGDTHSFSYAVTRDQAIALAHEFIRERLPKFGPYEDAMALDEPVLFHSRLSLYMNNGLLDPVELCELAQQAYQEGHAPIESVEGFIRQILGWREYIRIYYEAMMPEIREANHFGFTRGLPEAYVTGEHPCKCVSESLKPVIEDAWSHHIPRLMILSSFSNLTKTDPRELNTWFWLAYADAHEWVELPNVLGMSTFADGGVLASKPYVSGGAYINKMSNYCAGCSYNVKEKTGPDACPFNYLYWNFVDQQRETFSRNGRVNFMVNSFDKKSEDEKADIRKSAQTFIDAQPRLESGWETSTPTS
jgi:deoxyribodipyrimidine photolyase-related protein